MASSGGWSCTGQPSLGLHRSGAADVYWSSMPRGSAGGHDTPDRNLGIFRHMADRQHYTATQVASALRECKGGLYLKAKRLGCSVQTVLNYCHRYPTVQAAKEEERGVMIDEAELRLWAAIQDGHPWAITFCLRTIGRHRGYVE